MKKKSFYGSDLSSDLSEESRNTKSVETLGDRIRFIWILSGLKRDELAERLGITSATLTNYAGNKRFPTSDFLTRISSEFNVSPSWLLLLEGPMFLSYNPEYPDLSPSPESEDGRNFMTQELCERCRELEGELSKERTVNRELASDNRELNKENRQLMRENGDLRVELERMKARAAPDQETPNEAHRKAG